MSFFARHGAGHRSPPHGGGGAAHPGLGWAPSSLHQTEKGQMQQMKENERQINYSGKEKRSEKELKAEDARKAPRSSTEDHLVGMPAFLYKKPTVTTGELEFLHC